MQQEQLNQQLIATRSLLSQSSQHQERVRIARDLHDILGHQLTALSLQLEVLSHKVPDEIKPDVEQSKQVSKELLASIRAQGTVKNHISNILLKLESRDRTQAVLKALQLRLI